ncbi:MAG: hypothetical protein J5950_02920 [Clostridia bacterium]|nr:hypothetical protein [Clostridia bacterium]
MEKSLYSLMLMDDVVKEVDRLAFRRGTNRSNMINQILAEYLSMTTPEKRIGNIFRQIESAMNRNSVIVPFVDENARTMLLKSSLEYKYRPTIKYEVELYKIPRGAIGELTVTFRTQSDSLIKGVNSFLSIWMNLEEHYLGKYFPGQSADYKVGDGRFVRTIHLRSDRDHSDESVGKEISDYIQNFDALIKGYLSGEYGAADIERKYVDALNGGIGIL